MRNPKQLCLAVKNGERYTAAIESQTNFTKVNWNTYCRRLKIKRFEWHNSFLSGAHKSNADIQNIRNLPQRLAVTACSWRSFDPWVDPKILSFISSSAMKFECALAFLMRAWLFEVRHDDVYFLTSLRFPSRDQGRVGQGPGGWYKVDREGKMTDFMETLRGGRQNSARDDFARRSSLFDPDNSIFEAS